MRKNIASLEQAFLCIALIALPGCIHRKQIDRQKLHIDLPATKNILTIPAQAPSITIWVHGTLIFRKPIYHQVFGDTSCLMPITSLPNDHHFRVLANTIAEHDPEHFPVEKFYVFGWSGKLQNQERKDAANKLYHEVITLRELYKQKYGCEPTIRIIAHSHGGNVVLNMAKIKTTDKPFQIKSLILLACPVQEKTMHLISTPMFQRVYSLYSSLDIIQIIAPQFKRACTTNCLNAKRKYHYRIFPFSSRLFPIYSHLTQAKIKINDFPISHTRFSTQEFTSLLPTILQKLDSWHNESLATNKITKHKLLCIYKKKQN
ncbi:MAG TPA: hypothetical protein VJJ26_02695 [Candidatus Babeliales bacterium]|nr:hypothetical protein [Candidatus Babeliales bacterium]